jgi:hypothetical protein
MYAPYPTQQQTVIEFCENCNIPLEVKTAKTGNQFWGCPNYKSGCRFTKNMNGKPNYSNKGGPPPPPPRQVDPRFQMEPVQQQQKQQVTIPPPPISEYSMIMEQLMQTRQDLVVLKTALTSVQEQLASLIEMTRDGDSKSSVMEHFPTVSATR